MLENTFDWTSAFSKLSKHNIHRPKTAKNVTDQANIQSAETEPWSLNMATIRLAHPQCAAGMQSIYETNAAATTAEWGHCKHWL